MKGKKLYFGMSVALPLDEAVAFKNSLGNEERYYLVKVKEDPKNVHIDRREEYVVARHLSPGEAARRAYTIRGEAID